MFLPTSLRLKIGVGLLHYSLQKYDKNLNKQNNNHKKTNMKDRIIRKYTKLNDIHKDLNNDEYAWLGFIPDNLGINLCSVEGFEEIEVIKEGVPQLVSLRIDFDPVLDQQEFEEEGIKQNYN